jgi:anti-anti-sigma factor
LFHLERVAAHGEGQESVATAGESAHLSDTDDQFVDPIDAAVSAPERSGDEYALSDPAQPLTLSVGNPATGVCVITVEGELDLLTTPLLDACLRQQLATEPSHLIIDLQPLRFLGSTGLNCLIEARGLTQTTRTRLHLAGLISRVVARPLRITELTALFDTYSTLTEALAPLAP